MTLLFHAEEDTDNYSNVWRVETAVSVITTQNSDELAQLYGYTKDDGNTILVFSHPNPLNKCHHPQLPSVVVSSFAILKMKNDRVPSVCSCCGNLV